MRYKVIRKNGEISSICNNFRARRALSIPVSSCSFWKQNVCNIFSLTLIFFSVGHRKKYENSIVSNSVSRHDGVILEYKDMMT